MQQFKFQSNTKFIAGPEAIQQLGDEAIAMGSTNVLIVTDLGIIDAGLLDPVLKALEKAGCAVTVFDGVAPNPTDETAIKGAEIAKASGAKVIVGLGGGSPMDAAKAIAVMATNPGPFIDYCGAGADPWPNSPLPVLAVPTTAGTGAEVSAAAMINLSQVGRKVDIFGPSILPKIAIADPMLTLSLPEKLTAWTGIDALSHAVEAYVCVRANPISDAIAERSISLVAENIQRACRDGEDVDARNNMLIASAMAVMAASNAGGLGVIHSLAQTLGGFYNLPHGLTIATCFAVGLAYNVETVPAKYAKIAALLGTDVSQMSTAEAAAAVIPATERLIEAVGITDTFETMGVQVEDIPQLAEYAMLDGCTPTNPRSLQQDDFVRLFTDGF